MGLINWFTFNGINSTDYGIYISGSGTFNAPEMDITTIEIPGRNGDLTISNNRFKNITVEYPAFIRKQFRNNSAAAKQWLLNQSGYCILTDTYHPEFFRKARFTGPMDFETRFLNYSAEFTISFNCMPQRWLVSGSYPMTFTAPFSLFNQYYPALPLITVYGSGQGSLTVGGNIIQISNIDEYVTLDSDTQNAYKGTLNQNSTISLSTFPVIPQGETGISWSGGITQIQITPRWWTI